MPKKASVKDSPIKEPKEPKNSPSKKLRKGPKKRPGSDTDGASSVAEAMADDAAELKTHSSNGADIEAAPKETSSVMTEIWKHLAENASKLFKPPLRRKPVCTTWLCYAICMSSTLSAPTFVCR